MPNFSEPTPHMRFVERMVVVPIDRPRPEVWANKVKVRILQQLWSVIEDGSYRRYCEWRDVELTEETKWTADE